MTTQGPVIGLTAEEVERRRAAGQTNQPPHSATKTVGEIVRDNVCTYFNLVFLLLAMALAMVGSYANMTFLGVVVCNTVIGIVQQLRSKKAVDELTLVAARRVRCLRTNRQEDFGPYTAEFGRQYAIMLESSVPIVAQYGRAEPRAVNFYTTPGYCE